MSAKFGPGGNPVDFPYKSSLDAPGWLAGMGLDLYEYECGRGVNIGEDSAREMGVRARQAGIELTLHAPYFISLANPDPESLKKTIGYVISSCRAADWMGATRVVVHSGSLMKRTRREAQDISLKSLSEVIKVCDGEGYGHITLCPETMGKINQLGDLDEVLELCELDARLLPTVDFGHLYARSLGADEGGEKCHRTFADHGGFGPDPAPLMEELARRGWSPTIICESAGTQAEDALTMKKMYQAYREQVCP